MKAILLLGIVIFLGLPPLHAQAYQPMAKEGAHWIIGNQTLSPPWLSEKYSLTIRGDSVVNGKNYKKVFLEHFEFNTESKTHTNKIAYSYLYALMRDDTLQRKVYAIIREALQRYCSENEENLLYDFSAKEGDSLTWCILNTRKFSSGCRADSIRMLKHRFSDLPVKAIYTRLGYSSYSDSESLVIERTVPIFEGFGSELFSPFLSGNVLINYCVGSDADCGLIVSSKQLVIRPIKIFPNPTSDLLNVEKDNRDGQDISNSMLEIVDATGKIVKRQQLQNSQNKIAVQNLPKGFYLLRLNKGNGSFYQSYFIKM